MNTDEACALLGELLNRDQSPISKRTLQRYAADNLLSVRMVPGDGTRSVADYSEAELRELPRRLQERRAKPARPAVAAAASEALAVETLLNNPDSPAFALLTMMTEGARQLAEALKLAHPAGDGAGPLLLGPAPPQDELHAYTLVELAQLSGYSKDFLAGECRAGRLKAHKRRGWRVTHKNFAAWLDRLHKPQKPESDAQRKKRLAARKELTLGAFEMTYQSSKPRKEKERK